MLTCYHAEIDSELNRTNNDYFIHRHFQKQEARDGNFEKPFADSSLKLKFKSLGENGDAMSNFVLVVAVGHDSM